MNQSKHESGLVSQLNLTGLVHVSGRSGSGKTLFAIALAADYARHSPVQWVSTDGKLSFASTMKKNVSPDDVDRISILTTLGFQETYDVLMNLEIKPKTLVIIDTITRVLDMSSHSSEMWGRELIEDILPTLAANSQKMNSTIIIVNESRYTGEEKLTPILHDAIARWADHDVELRREYLKKKSTIQMYGHEDILATLVMNNEGKIVIDVKEECEQCLENCSILSST